MKISIISFLIFFTFNFSFSQLKDSYIVDLEGNKILLYQNIKKKSYTKNDFSFSSDYAITTQFFYYHDKNGELIKQPQAKLDSVILENHIFITKGIKGNGGPKRLHEILVKSDKFLITQYYSGSFRVLYIYDHEDKCVLNRTNVSLKLKDDTKTLEKEIKPRFKDCPELIKLIEENLASKYYFENGRGSSRRDNMFQGVYNYKCK